MQKVSAASFLTFILIDDKNDMNASTAFVSLTLFNMIRYPIMLLPVIIASLIQAHISFNRIYNFLMKEEINQSQIIYNKEDGILIFKLLMHILICNNENLITDTNAIILNKVSSGWTEDKTILKKYASKIYYSFLIVLPIYIISL